MDTIITFAYGHMNQIEIAVAIAGALIVTGVAVFATTSK